MGRWWTSLAVLVALLAGFHMLFMGTALLATALLAFAFILSFLLTIVALASLLSATALVPAVVARLPFVPTLGRHVRFLMLRWPSSSERPNNDPLQPFRNQRFVIASMTNMGKSWSANSSSAGQPRREFRPV